MQIEHVTVANFEAALRGMRNPLNSWAKSTPEADVELGRKLSAAGPVHGKFLRMITITCDITAPLYWWKEFDTYKVGTVANSCSTMHTLINRPLELDDFETEGSDLTKSCLLLVLDTLNDLIEEHKASPKNNYEAWKALIAMLPSCYLQKRTVMLNYEVLRRIVKDRTGHKLKEWTCFIEAMNELPYYNEFILGKTSEECLKEDTEKSFEERLEEDANAYKEVFNTIPFITKSITTKSFKECIKENFVHDISNNKIELLYKEAEENMMKETMLRIHNEAVKALNKELEKSEYYVAKKKDEDKPETTESNEKFNTYNAKAPSNDITNSKPVSIKEEDNTKFLNELHAGFSLPPIKDDIQKEVVSNDPINPAHYKDHCSIECIGAMVIVFSAWETAHFCMCNAFKYLWRHKYKNGQEDLKKALWYLDKAEELGEDDNEKIDELRKTVEKYMKEEK